ncbi:lysM and putative peptidoglycan-binding domain-containing protein 1 [Syngnathus typhle]|uniref:lysM and putative peptidoglycan-binding domain-containing protein 1 n=1 Tax=Syngnathus typhle TaxID=161592 RepID=UPI002A6A5E46|nr:lysM and putative peptidoglycan-binding domain-containing protein 1 [Syngnathus typhle]XP_061145248.1 lysM and putative peptidoglycan-binding domain-containing protein 1 [Syngnathus typhle]
MSAGKEPADAGGNGLLRGGRSSKSYGSLVRSNVSPVRRRPIEHCIQPGETLQGLALKYGVTTEQIKRVNRLYTNDSIFQRKSLSIPVPSRSEAHQEEEDQGERLNHELFRDDKSPTASPKELTATDFLSRLDGVISESKRAAARRWQDAEKRLADLEALCSSRMNERPAAAPPPPSAAAAAVPLTATKLTMKLREREDDIFEL